MRDQIQSACTATPTRSRRAFALTLALLLAAGLAAPGCASNPTTYGAKLVSVTITISPPAAIEASTAAFEPEAWVIQTRTWVGAKKRLSSSSEAERFRVMKEEFAELNFLRREGDDEQADQLVRELRFVLDRDQEVMQGAGETSHRLPATTLYLVVLYNGSFTYREFDATTERSVDLRL